MPIPTLNTRIYIRDAAGTTDIEIKGHTSISGLDGERAEIDETTLLDEAEVVALGIKRYGSVSLAMFHEPDDPGQQELEAVYQSGEKRKVSWLLPNGTARVFDAYVKNFPFENGEIDNRYKSTINVRVSGDVVKVENFTPATP
ncbi:MULTISPECIES: phage tail tube protein [unclassified Marinobacterium]|uniref:phage tail tube protein n=1 Tax=unclassified Marinobacterium TaxID=2644139 RepID=UPI0032E57573